MFKNILSLIIAAVLTLNAHYSLGDEDFPSRKYVCPPCKHVHSIFETKEYQEAGKCPVCGMNLIEKPFYEKDELPTIHAGSGSFQFKSKRSNATTPITVFYHKPSTYSPNSKILLVIPGAGRNAWSYRDNWAVLAEKHNVLVVSPFYPEKDYSYSAYHLAGVVAGIEFKNYTVSKVDGRVNKYHVADTDVITGAITPNDTWLFQDFDEIFDLVVSVAHSNRQSYDIFGHSAGGQILHRFAILGFSTKVDRIIAANSGSYTLPHLESEYPLGIKGIEIQSKSLKGMFSRKLTLLVGELDNAEEHRGTLLHTPALDKQGLGRLSRGRSFYAESMSVAKAMGGDFEWGFCMVEGVGHERNKMALAAAKLLYGGELCTARMGI
ncbi:hypothetical protein KO528_08975 [Saccharophagus degradans]|uniref:heavy metal-binding domain-containing protein n=1 Tax=Saccharophagus degradans TaxID=86304 RepID=UPI001C08F0B1|nr:heavy metal-binding domain-containing protein [Saccharophagus degradans]MBU2985483.1 hypothetical protein [Saccharophagus degradans]